MSLFKKKAYLHFENKTFEGLFICSKDYSEEELEIWGEAVFTTVQSGYQESITDPSFLGQHLTFSYPHIGNYPYNEKANQSFRPHVTSVICNKIHYNEFFRKFDIPVLTNIDQRELIKFITKNKQKSVISFNETPPSKTEFDQKQLICNELDHVSQSKPETLIPGSRPICFINYGTKQAIVEFFKDLDIPLKTFPHNVSAEEILKENPRLIFLSNGPGDPAEYKSQIKEIEKLLQSGTPIRGICLGFQLLSLALGAKTYKLPFGHRGGNHPVIDHFTGKVLITSQNHGYAVHEQSLKDLMGQNILGKELMISESSLFDRSIEGLATTDSHLRAVQFHPEANPGPWDAFPFFTEIKDYLNGIRKDQSHWEAAPEIVDKPYKKDIPYKKVLLIGSGPIKIGQASEFDYSGTQALKALKEEGIEVVLLNSNPATIMTDEDLADKTYIEPINLDTLCKIIDKENVDAIITTMGGQTALNLSLELQQSGFLEGKDIALLGAGKDTIEKTEDRELFAKELKELGYNTGKRIKTYSDDETLKVAKEQIHYPLIIRKDFALGGKGSTIILNEEEMKNFLDKNDEYPITIERSLLGFKEVELEVMVDKDQNGLIICSIENIDPCGIHTGDSITVAPAQTISDRCMQNMRTMALKIAKKMGVVAGGANVQFAINPRDEDDIIVIEMNPRVSRSSALASKATGYPIAKISAKLALGYNLKEILNDITKVSPVSFEPTQDYVAIKVPLFPFNKFPRGKRLLDTQMKSVGEVLAIGSNFNESLFKALRSLETGLEIPKLHYLNDPTFIPSQAGIKRRLSEFRELSLLTVLEAIRSGFDKSDIANLSNIDPWFIDRMEEFHWLEKSVMDGELELNKTNLKTLKLNGFTDKYLALISNKSEKDIYELREKFNLFPSYRAVDTCSGEFDAETPYFYSTYESYNEAPPLGNSIVITGSGPNRIGQGIEFDYSCVKACMSVRDLGKNSIMINSNPETVSTDYDTSSRLYLSPLYSEDVFDILKHEDPEGVIWSFSGQTGINLREKIDLTFKRQKYAPKFLGSPIETLERCEDRGSFSKVLENLDLSITKSEEIQSYKELIKSIEKIGFPVIMRPSYVIGGESMFILKNMGDIDRLPEYALNHLHQGKTTFLVESYVENAYEYDVDIVRDQKGNCILGVCEHIEHAGVHSGDSGMITPPKNINDKTKTRLIDISKKMAEELNIVGPINIQFAVKGKDIYCIEANPRGSRTIPFLSKAYHRPLSTYAVKAMIGGEIPDQTKIDLPYYCVKQSTFPFDRFLDDNNTLGPIMKSTGETMGIDQDINHAIIKSYLANFKDFTTKGKVLISLSDQSKKSLMEALRLTKDFAWDIYATPGTYGFLQGMGIECKRVEKLHKDKNTMNMKDILLDKDLNIVINTPYNSGKAKSDGDTIRGLASIRGAAVFTREENIISFLESFKQYAHGESTPYNLQELKLQEMNNL